MTNQPTKFDLWWNSYSTKRLFSAVFSVGAAIVILGAMFKILHLPGSEWVLGFGMSVEVLVFALGAFDKPHKEFDWNQVFDFEGKENQKLNASGASQPRSVGVNYSESISDEDIKKLSQGIKSLSTTAQQLTTITSVVDVAENFSGNLEKASNATKKFTSSQENIAGTLEQLHSSYLGISSGMETVEKNTKTYATKVDDINKNLSSINAMYEIQLRNIQAQSEGLTAQSTSLRNVSDELNAIDTEIKKIKLSTVKAVEETENFKSGSILLAKQVSDLNKVYGNMLNSFN